MESKGAIFENKKYTIFDTPKPTVRFKNYWSLFEWDNKDINPSGLGFHRDSVKHYLENRTRMTSEKQQLLEECQKNLQADKEFLDLVYQAKSDKRKKYKSKAGGIINIPRFAMQDEKVFDFSKPGKKKVTLDMAFQVGTFVNESYEDGFVKIMKTVLMCQALNINLRIDVFDSDTSAVGRGCYVICNIVDGKNKFNFRDLCVFSHPEFFNHSLFNGYTAITNHMSNCNIHCIGTFLHDSTITSDLKNRYDVIGGNMLTEDTSEGTVSQVLKIAKILH